MTAASETGRPAALIEAWCLSRLLALARQMLFIGNLSYLYK